MNQKYKTLVAIPNFNNEEYLVETIRSVLMQDILANQEVEIVIFDNASTDKSVQIVNDLFSVQQIKVIVNSKNIGPIANHNLCLEYAINNRYDFVKILSSDDALLPGVIRNQAKILIENPNIHLVSCDLIVTDNKLFFSHLQRYVNLKEKISFINGESLIKKCVMHTKNLIGGPSNFLLRVNGIGDNKFRDDFRWLSDLIFACEIVKSGTYAHINTPGFFYRRHNNTDSNIISQQRGLQQKEWIAFIKNYNHSILGILRIALLKLKLLINNRV